MPNCPGCTYPIHPTQILCNRCYNQDFVNRWPKCEACFSQDACGDSGYVLCFPCHFNRCVLRQEAAIKIQRLFREVLEKYDAATRIQALWRGHWIRTGHQPFELKCVSCRIENATMVNEYGNFEDVCAGCFWDIREEWRHQRHRERLTEMEKLIPKA